MRTGYRIRKFVATLTDDHETSRDPLADGLLDSLAIEQLIQYLEGQFRITFEDGELVSENFASIETLASLVDSKQRASR
jgi:acyl carrier protein